MNKKRMDTTRLHRMVDHENGTALELKHCRGDQHFLLALDLCPHEVFPAKEGDEQPVRRYAISLTLQELKTLQAELLRIQDYLEHDPQPVDVHLVFDRMQHTP